MGARWTHAKWGTFKHDGTEWAGKVEAPAFHAFTFHKDHWDEPRRPRTFPFGFESFDEKDLPAAEMVAVAERVLAAQEQLVGKVTKALWDEFNGRGGESGMWWHGDMDQVAVGLEDADLKVPKKADDILPLMRLSSISVRPRVDGYDKPLVELRFYAVFEEEHGVGVLTDGRKILGTGYSIDATPYPSEVIEKKAPPKQLKGRIVSPEGPLTDWIELAVQSTKGGSVGYPCKWDGTFTAPAGFDLKKLTRPNAFKFTLELKDGTAINVFLMAQDASGQVTFFCPGAPEIP